jgi:predicted PP-loop superfamily ATPase
LRASDDHAAALVLQNLERNDERISLLASGMALKAVENANKRKKSLPINTVQDLDKAVMISKRAAGKDREESKVTVALFGGQQSAQGPMIDAAKRFRVRIAEGEVVHDC